MPFDCSCFYDHRFTQVGQVGKCCAQPFQVRRPNGTVFWSYAGINTQLAVITNTTYEMLSHINGFDMLRENVNF
jgi:hypothetical protein